MRINLKDSIVSRAMLRKFGIELSVKKLVKQASVDPDFSMWVVKEKRASRKRLALKIAIAKEVIKNQNQVVS